MSGKNLSRTIFKNSSVTYYTASLFFPADTRVAVETLYAFVRTADDFVDATPQDSAGLYAFVREYRLALAKKISSSDKRITEFIALQEKFKFKQVWIDAFLKAMELDLYKSRYTSLRELEAYMYGSAEVIGCMLSCIFSLPESSLLPARMLGKAMQYANFIRDIAEDTQLGRQYLPSEIYSGNEVYSLQRECVRYATWSRAAKRGIQTLPRRYRVPVETAAALYDWTVSCIQKNPKKVWQQKIKPHPLRVMITAILYTLRSLFLRISLH